MSTKTGDRILIATPLDANNGNNVRAELRIITSSTLDQREVEPSEELSWNANQPPCITCDKMVGGKFVPGIEPKKENSNGAPGAMTVLGNLAIGFIDKLLDIEEIIEGEIIDLLPKSIRKFVAPADAIIDMIDVIENSGAVESLEGEATPEERAEAQKEKDIFNDMLNLNFPAKK